MGLGRALGLVAGAIALTVAVVALPVALTGSPGRAKPWSGTVSEGPTEVVAGAWQAVTWRVHAGPPGMDGGMVTVSVPPGWAAPTLAAGAGGWVRASAGQVAVVGRTVVVGALQLAPGQVLALSYGGGPGEPTEPTTPGLFAFAVAVRDRPAGPPSPVVPVPSVVVQPPPAGCTTTSDPHGMGPTRSFPNATALANFYNLAGAGGWIRQCTGPQGLQTSLALSSPVPVGDGPLGYPEVAYGYDLVDQPFCRLCHSTPFPLSVSALESPARPVTVEASYSLGVPTPAQLPVDFVYDLWVERQPSPGRLPGAGDVEIVVFLYQRSMAGCPAGRPPQQGVLAVSFDGQLRPARFALCTIRGGTAATPVAFFLEDPLPARQATIALPLGDLVLLAGRYLGQSLAADQLMGIELGGELDLCTPAQGCTADRLSWSWQVASLTLRVGPARLALVFSTGAP